MMAAVTLLTIALGTGLNVAIFRAVGSALLNPLPYANAAQLVQLGVEQADGGMSPADRRLPNGLTVQFWRSHSRSFQAIGSYRPWRTTIGSGGDPDASRLGPCPLSSCRLWVPALCWAGFFRRKRFDLARTMSLCSAMGIGKLDSAGTAISLETALSWTASIAES